MLVVLFVYGEIVLKCGSMMKVLVVFFLFVGWNGLL